MKRLICLQKIGSETYLVRAVLSGGRIPPADAADLKYLPADLLGADGEKSDSLLGATWVGDGAGLRRACLVDGFEGMGDTIYVRPAIRRMSLREKTVYIRTPWPQLFWDLPDVLPVRPKTALRTQGKNVERTEWAWHTPPEGIRVYSYSYSWDDLQANRTPLQTFMGQLKVSDPVDFRLPVNPAWETDRTRSLPERIGVVHPPSVRKEWKNTSRNPRMEYLQEIIDARPNLHWVSIGWLSEGEEWLDGPPLRGIGSSFDGGELRFEEMLALVARAKMALCGPSFLLPIGAALGVPTVCVFGGSVPPRLLIDPRMGSHVTEISPEPFCECFQMEHPCNKGISRERLTR